MRLVVSGLILGLTFLAHSGAAALLGGIMLATAWTARPSARTGSRQRLTWVLPPAIALVVSAPLLIPIATTYGFHVSNRAPSTWIYEAAQPEAAMDGWTRPSALLQVAVMLVGMYSGETSRSTDCDGNLGSSGRCSRQAR